MKSVNAHIDNDTLLGCRTASKEDSTNKEEVNNCIKILLLAITGQDAKIMKKLNKMVEGNTEAVAAAKTAELLLDTDFHR